MKITILVAVLLFYWNLEAQTATELVAQGRSDLAAQDITDANASFAQAVALSSTNEDANALYAFTRLLILPYQPAGSNFLTRIGLPLAGRNLYAWAARPPEDDNGLLLAPAGVNADEFTAQFRTNVLLAVSAAIGNLAAVTNTNYTIDLTSSETDLSAVTMDYGDLELIRAGLYASEYFIYTLNAQNFDAQLTDLRALYTGGTLSAGQLLADYPQLFTFATTNDLQSARVAFTNAVNCYMAASAFIRARPPGEVRLFNYDRVSAQEEGDFRSTLQELQNSLVLGPQILSVNPAVSVDAAPLFSGSPDWRSLLPKFDGNAIELGSLQDLTFGGVVDGLTRNDVEGFLGQRLTMLPVGGTPAFLSDNSIQVAFTTLSGHNYVLQTSTNLLDWELMTNFVADDDISTLVDLQSGTMSRRFYRLRDDTGFMAFSGVVVDQSTGLPIAGAQIYSDFDGATTYSDANGQFYLLTSLSVNYGEDELQVSAAGYGTLDQTYYGDGLVSGLQIYLGLPPNDNFENRTILNGSTVTASGNNSEATYENGDPYPINYAESVWFSWTPPVSGSYTISVDASYYAPILGVYTGSQLSNLSIVGDNFGYLYNAGYNIASLNFIATGGQTYQIGIDNVEALYGGAGGAYTLTIVPEF